MQVRSLARWGKRGGEQPGRGPGLLVAMTEKSLRKHHALGADDQIVEWKQGKIQQWSVAGSPQPHPRAFNNLDIPQLRGMSSCSYSSRRLFFGSNGTVFADLESVWHADTSAKVLRIVFSSSQLTVIRWRSDEAEDAAALAGFSKRIMAQRDRRLAELSPAARQQAGDRLAEFQRIGLLAAALAQPEAPSRSVSRGGQRTYIGQWLRAVLLRQTELRDRLHPKLNGGDKGWNDDEPAVVQAACELAVARFFGTSYDVRAITAFVAELREATANDPAYDQLKTEAVIRSALGEQDVDTAGITAGQKFSIRLMVLTLAFGKLGLSEANVDHLITDAEKIAVERGFDPPLVD